MRKLFFCMLLATFTFNSFAQDVVVRANGDSANYKMTKLDSLKMSFTDNRNGKEASTSIDKSQAKDVRSGESVKGNKLDSSRLNQNYRKCLTIGILEGGGSLIGADFEVLLSNYFGLQVGAGIIGYGGSLNVHFKPNIRSSFVSLQYWHQGIGASHTQTVIGPSMVFRGKKWFTAQLGFGFAAEKGPAWPSDMKQPEVMLTYAIGGYIPW